MIGLPDAPVAGPAAAAPANPTNPLDPAADWAALEHRHGVLPLLAACFAAPAAFAEVTAGRRRGALGLFTPAPEPGWAAAAVAGEPAGEGGLRLRGDVRLAGPGAGGAIVLARLPDAEHRLVWVDLDQGMPGVELRGPAARDRGAPAGGGACWLRLGDAAIGAGGVSRPVTPAPDGELARLLAAYAGTWARAAASSAVAGARALRRAARRASCQGSQLVALGITEVEIEAGLAAAAAERGPGGLAVAVGAARALAAVAARTRELCEAFGLAVGGPFGGGPIGGGPIGGGAEGSAGAAGVDGADPADPPGPVDGGGRRLLYLCGGPLLLESELARALGIGEARA